MSLVSRRFHSLVTTPHAWRVAFSRYFLGPASLRLQNQNGPTHEADEFERVLLERRSFSRLTALASWRNEYILRTRLLRSLSRGRPAEYPIASGGRSTGPAPGSSPAHSPNAVVTYGSLLFFPLTHLDARFGSGLEKKFPHFVHGASEQGTASTSEPTSGRVGAGSWGISDPQFFNHAGDMFPSDQQWGLGAGELIGAPNTMDLSQQFGMVYGEGCPPEGRVYFLSTGEKRGRFLTTGDAAPDAHRGIPNLNRRSCCVCSVWIAKFPAVLELTGGIFGILAGSSLGVLTAYSLGPHPSYTRRLERGEVMARWVLSPGVPIISIKVDDNYSAKRSSQRRVWAVVLNALGEVFYLADVPSSQQIPNPNATADEIDQAAWATGRSVGWELVESTRRVAQLDPHDRLPVDGSYSPSYSQASTGLTRDQVAAETREIEQFLSYKPKDFRKVCQGWDMRRKLEVDFAGDDLHGAGESIVVVSCGSAESSSASIQRYTRLKHDVALPSDQKEESFPQLQPSATSQPSLFGGPETSPTHDDAGLSEPLSRSSSVRVDAQLASATAEWRMSDLVFDLPKSVEITATTMDTSNFAQMTVAEDPLLTMCGLSSSSSSSSSSPPSQMSSPLWHSGKPTSRADVPGQGARFLALGTSNGAVYIWNVRAATSQTPGITNQIYPLRVINTDSPQISSLGMTSLYLVHGGNDGLVQAWDPLASSTQSIRTLNSRFSSRARRHLAQAQAAAHGVGQHNYFAAGAICLDPDPTRLRGIMALGTQLRYWSYSSSAADRYKSAKRRLRYSQRGNNTSPESQKFNNSGRGALHDYIVSEKRELEREKVAREKERARLHGRFGVDLLGPDASEDDMLAYACMLSEESYTSRDSGSEHRSESSLSSSDTVGLGEGEGEGADAGAGAGAAATPTPPKEEKSKTTPDISPGSVDVLDPAVDEEGLDPDVVEAIRRSLQDASVADDPDPDAPPPPPQPQPASFAAASSSHNHPAAESSSSVAGVSRQEEDADLEFAVQLSMAEQRSLGVVDAAGSSTSVEEQGQQREQGQDEKEEFPALGSGSSAGTPSSDPRGGGGSRKSRDKGKGKGKKGKEVMWG